MRYLSYLLLVCLFHLSIQSLNATVIHVPGDSTTIQSGINGAVDGDTVMVAPGTYFEHDIDFLGKAITVMSTDPVDSAVVASTVVDADSQGVVFYFHSWEESADTYLMGLTITGGSSANGGGIYCVNASPTIRNNVITGNYSSGDGGGIKCDYSYAFIVGNKIIANSTYYSGGGICCRHNDPTISSNIIRDNSAMNSKGGGIHCYDCSPYIFSNVITGNSAGLPGGGLSTGWNAEPTITNNTISNNTAIECGGLWCYGLGPTVTNCIIWGNANQEIIVDTGFIVVLYSDIEGGWGGEGNIDEDPLFVDPDNDDYHLHSTSPCVDAGDPVILDACRPPGLRTERSDMGGYGGEENCGWSLEASVYLLIWPNSPVVVPKGDYLDFNTFIRNTRNNIVEGDYWLSALLPDSNEILIFEGLLGYSNPLHGQVFPFDSVELSDELWVHPRADTGSYQLIGRIGQYPNMIIDEESFGFRVVEQDDVELKDPY